MSPLIRVGFSALTSVTASLQLQGECTAILDILEDIANDEDTSFFRSFTSLCKCKDERHNMYIICITYVASSKSNIIGQL